MATRITAIILFLCGLTAHATVYNISAGASQGTIQSTLQTAASASGNNTVQFAAGTYSINSTLSIPCPASGTLTITGPATTYGQRNVIGSWNARPTAFIVNTNLGGGNGSAVGNLFSESGCTNPVVVEYLDINGNHPVAGGGGFDIEGVTGFTASYNYIHGMNTYYPVISGNSPNQGIDVPAFTESNSFYLGGGTNITITWNIIGNAANPGNNDCGTGSGQGMMVWAGSVINGNTFVGYDQSGGACGAIWQQGNFTNVTIANNVFQNIEEGIKGLESTPNTIQNMNYLNNDFAYIHHSFQETQMNAPNASQPWTSSFNDFHDPYAPAFATWYLSLAQNTYAHANDNLNISNNASGGVNGWNPLYEYWGISTSTNNLFQGQNACGYTFYSPGGGSISNNTFQIQNGGSNGVCDVPNGPPQGGCGDSGSWPNATVYGIQSECEPGQTVANYPTMTGNVYTTSPSAIQSTAPTFSPNGGGFSGSQVVTLIDAGNTGGSLPRGNTGIWYTTDGSTPSPRCATCSYAATGDTITLTNTTTLQAVGMWGALNQPASYTNTNNNFGTYGYTPSAVVSAVFTKSGGGTPTAVAPTFNPGTSTIPSTGVAVTLSTSTSPASIYYCIGSCTPTSGSTLYTGPITVNSTSTYNAITIAAGYNNSAVTSATYTVSGPSQAATPVPSVGTGTFSVPFNLTLTSATSGASIYYCVTAGCVPNATSTLYTAPIPISQTITINAIAIAAGYTNSQVMSATYTYLLFIGQNQITADVQTYSPGMVMTYAVTRSNPAGYSVQSCVINQSNGPEGVTNGALTDCLIISAPTPTTEASTPVCHGTYTNTSATAAVGTIDMTSAGCGTLTPNTAYWIAVSTNDTKNPSSYGGWSPGSGTTLTPVPTGATNTGTYPGAFEGTVPYGTYTGFPSSLTVNAGTSQFSQYVTLTALAPTMAATPVISPSSGTHSGTVSVTITDSTSGASIYYCTTNGCVPTTTSTLYTGAFNVTSPAQVNAIAAASGFTNSAVGTATYAPASTISTVSVCTGGGTPLCSVTPACPNCVLAGGTQQLVVKIVYTDATVTYNTTVGTPDSKGTSITSWVSSNSSIGTVSTAGLFTGGTCPGGQLGCTTQITATVTGGTTATWLESLATSLTSGIQGGTIQ